MGTRSGFCNFMHLKPISRKLRSELYGRDSRRGPDPARSGLGDLKDEIEQERAKRRDRSRDRDRRRDRDDRGESNGRSFKEVLIATEPGLYIIILFLRSALLFVIVIKMFRSDQTVLN